MCMGNVYAYEICVWTYIICKILTTYLYNKGKSKHAITLIPWFSLSYVTMSLDFGVLIFSSFSITGVY